MDKVIMQRITGGDGGLMTSMLFIDLTRAVNALIDVVETHRVRITELENIVSQLEAKSNE